MQGIWPEQWAPAQRILATSVRGAMWMTMRPTPEVKSPINGIISIMSLLTTRIIPFNVANVMVAVAAVVIMINLLLTVQTAISMEEMIVGFRFRRQEEEPFRVLEWL